MATAKTDKAAAPASTPAKLTYKGVYFSMSWDFGESKLKRRERGKQRLNGKSLVPFPFIDNQLGSLFSFTNILLLDMIKSAIITLKERNGSSYVTFNLFLLL